MYKGKRNILNKENYEYYRKLCIKSKPHAVYTAFSELENLINTTILAEQYFNKPGIWLEERIEGSLINKDSKSFTLEDYKKLAEAFRDIAQRLITHADEIDKASFSIEE